MAYNCSLEFLLAWCCDSLLLLLGSDTIDWDAVSPYVASDHTHIHSYSEILLKDTHACSESKKKKIEEWIKSIKSSMQSGGIHPLKTSETTVVAIARTSYSEILLASTDTHAMNRIVSNATVCCYALLCYDEWNDHATYGYCTTLLTIIYNTLIANSRKKY